MNPENVKKMFFLKWNLRKEFETKFGTVKFTYDLHLYLTAMNNFPSLSIVFILKYLNGKLLLCNKQVILLYNYIII